MRATNAEYRTSRRRLGAWTGGLTSAGAFVAVALMALSPTAGAVSSAALHGWTPYVYNFLQLSGCASGSAARPGISMTTGAGHLALKTGAHTCFPVSGGYLVQSYADAGSSLGASKTVKLTKAASMLNASFDVTGNVKYNASGVVLAKNCPVQHYSAMWYTTNSTGVPIATFYNSTQQVCYAQAGFDLYTEFLVNDLTTGTYSFFFSPGLYNTSGPIYDVYSYTYNYSGGGLTNSTFSGNASGSFGPGGAYALHATPSGNFSGSWAAGDLVSIQAYVSVFVYCQISYAKSAHAVSDFSATGATGHVNIVSLSFS